MGNHLGPFSEPSEWPVRAVGGQGQLRGVTWLLSMLETWFFLLFDMGNHLGAFPKSDQPKPSQNRADQLRTDKTSSDYARTGQTSSYKVRTGQINQLRPSQTRSDHFRAVLTGLSWSIWPVLACSELVWPVLTWSWLVWLWKWSQMISHTQKHGVWKKTPSL